MKIVEIKDMTFKYIKRNRIVNVFNNFNLVVSSGDFLVINAPTGCGKTTLLYIIAGGLKSYEGSVKVFGIEIKDASEKDIRMIRSKIGFIFQTFNLIESFTALENVIIPLILRGYKYKESLEIGKRILDIVGLADRISHHPSELSGGEMQRVGIARALSIKPSLILADEPTGNLDENTSEEIAELLYSINRDYEVTIIVATHDPIFKRYSKRVISLCKKY